MRFVHIEGNAGEVCHEADVGVELALANEPFVLEVDGGLAFFDSMDELEQWENQD